MKDVSLLSKTSLLESFEKNASDLKKLDLDVTTKLIKHSISIKAERVSEDEFEKLLKSKVVPKSDAT